MKLSKRLRKWRMNITTQTPLDYVLMLHEDILGFADEVKALEVENKKLRKLVRDMWDVALHPELFGDGSHLRERMIEMGIEVR